VQGSDSIKYLGVTLDCNLSLYAHIKNKCKVACFNMYRIRKIRRHLSLDSCKVLMQSLVISHLDYANGIYIGLPQRSIDLMQRVQNMAAKVTLKRSKYDSTTDSLKTLHWLPILQRIDFKILTLVFKCLRGGAPEYLRNMIRRKTNPRDHERNIYSYEFYVPKIKCQTFGGRAFSVAGPNKWNKLPSRLHNTENFQEETKRMAI